jgi:hypothetical protein
LSANIRWLVSLLLRMSSKGVRLQRWTRAAQPQPEAVLVPERDLCGAHRGHHLGALVGIQPRELRRPEPQGR